MGLLWKHKFSYTAYPGIEILPNMSIMGSIKKSSHRSHLPKVTCRYCLKQIHKNVIWRLICSFFSKLKLRKTYRKKFGDSTSLIQTLYYRKRNVFIKRKKMKDTDHRFCVRVLYIGVKNDKYSHLNSYNKNSFDVLLLDDQNNWKINSSTTICWHNTIFS